MFAGKLAKSTITQALGQWTCFEIIYGFISINSTEHTTELILHFSRFADYKLPVGLGVGLGGGVLIAAIIIILIVLVKRKGCHRFVKTQSYSRKRCSVT